MADERGASTAVLLAFLSGAAMGAVMGLLLAPQTCSESRDRLRGYARRAETDLRDFAGRAGEVFEEAVDQGREFVESKRSVLRDAFEAGREAMKRERGHVPDEGAERG